ncbi:MAG: solute:sodium symporter family transporter [Pirellulales bacterium]
MHILTLGSFLFFTGLVGLVTWILTRKDDHGSAQGYFLAGRTLTGGYIAGSLVLTNLSTEQLVGLNGAAYGDGICVMAWEVIAALALVVMSLLYLPRYLKSGIATVPQFLEQRFDSQTRTLTSAIFILAYAGILLPIILYTGATAMMDILNIQQLTGIESRQQILQMMVWMIGVLGSVYAIFGGLRTVAVSDSLNGLGLLVGGVMISLFGLHAVSDQGIFAALQELVQSHPEKFNSIGGSDQSVPFSTLFTGVALLNLSYWCTNQQIIQRALGASNLAEGQKGVLIAGAFKVMVPIILILPGIIAFHLYHEQSVQPDHAYGKLVQQVLPAPLTGFFAAVMVGAILSSYNSVLNSTATLFSLGIYKNLLSPDASETQVIHMGKRFGVVIAIGAMLAAPMLAGQESIFAYLQKMNGLYLIPIFAVVSVGLLSRRVPAIAAKLALILGCLGTALGYFVPALAERVDRMHEFHFLGSIFVSMIGFMLLLGWFYPRKTKWKLVDSQEVDLTPWKAAWPLAIVLVVTVLSLYVTFANG